VAGRGRKGSSPPGEEGRDGKGVPQQRSLLLPAVSLAKSQPSPESSLPALEPGSLLQARCRESYGWRRMLLPASTARIPICRLAWGPLRCLPRSPYCQQLPARGNRPVELFSHPQARQPAACAPQPGLEKLWPGRFSAGGCHSQPARNARPIPGGRRRGPAPDVGRDAAQRPSWGHRSQRQLSGRAPRRSHPPRLRRGWGNATG